MPTRHACIRAQQRAIPSMIIDLLLQYGVEEHDGHGAVRRYFDKRTRQQLERRLGRPSFDGSMIFSMPTL